MRIVVRKYEEELEKAGVEKGEIERAKRAKEE